MKEAMKTLPKFLGAALIAAGLAACSSDEAAPPATTPAPTAIQRVDYLTVTCGAQVRARGTGAAPNEVVKVRIQEQVAGGIDLSREVVADKDGNFTMGDSCDPLSPNAEVPALWSYVGTVSGRTGSNMIEYKLDPSATTPPTTSSS